MANNDMGKRIADRRKELHLSQTQLAEMTGYSDKTAIYKIEIATIDALRQKERV